MSKRAMFLFVTSVFIIPLHAQVNKELQDAFLEAEYFMMNGDYSDALTYYLPLYEKLPDNSNLAYRIGVCYLNIPSKKNLSVDFLTIAAKNMSAKRKEGSLTQVTAPYDAIFE